MFGTHDCLDEDEKQEVTYRNYLQSPLQPLADNLESATYEVFENDKIKYELYEEACYKAICDKLKFGHFKQTAHLRLQPDEDTEMSIEQPEIIVLYFGAGRGPLIHRAMNAAQRANATNVKVVALDKNPNAIVTLRNMIRD